MGLWYAIHEQRPAARPAGIGKQLRRTEVDRFADPPPGTHPATLAGHAGRPG